MTQDKPHDIIRERLLHRAGIGVDEKRAGGDVEVTPLAELRETQWNPEFERLQRNRLLIGYYRYGDLWRQSRGDYKYVESVIERAEKFLEDGNLEHLVDIANLCQAEFTNGGHPKRHFNPGDDGLHTDRR